MLLSETNERSVNLLAMMLGNLNFWEEVSLQAKIPLYSVKSGNQTSLECSKILIEKLKERKETVDNLLIYLLNCRLFGTLREFCASSGTTFPEYNIRYIQENEIEPIQMQARHEDARIFRPKSLDFEVSEIRKSSSDSPIRRKKRSSLRNTYSAGLPRLSLSK